MWRYKYGEYSENQVEDVKMFLRKQIYFLLIIVDTKTNEKYLDIDVNKVFENLFQECAGLNSLLLCPPALVTSMALLEAAKSEYNSDNFDFRVYRKLILDAGNEVLKIKEVV